MDALKKCDHDPHVIAVVAKLFWHDRKVDKARTWLNRAVTLAPDIGISGHYFSKAVENSHQPIESILKKVVVALGKEENAAESSKH
ncbi:protein STABILIZED1 [Sesbania bispinosa]|nr:protein STABILIZED1 [Sesbania bispinosa]